MKLYEKYDTEIPQEVVGIIAALGDPIRRAILVLLSKQAEFPFSDLQKELGIGKLTLNYHLKNLYSAGLVDHYFRHELGNQKYSYYAVTSLGKRALRSLVEMLTPPEYPSEKQEQKVLLRKTNSVVGLVRRGHVGQEV